MSNNSPILVRQLEIGPMENFVYLIGDPESRQAMIVDPAWEIDTIFKRANEENLQITGALLTHHHYDHTNGIEELLERMDVPVYVNKHDLEFVKTQKSHLTPIDQGEKIKIGNVEIETIHTPGHTPGSQCFKTSNGLITGDTLFIDGCGRCDLPGGDVEQMYYTLTQKIMRLPDETTIYPGHNYALLPTAHLSEQKKTNPYLRLASLSLDEFLKLRMKK